jgi:Aspartyl protease
MRTLKVLGFIILFIGCTIPLAAQSAPLANVPMTFPGPVPIIEVMINGQGPFHFTIDTGAQMQASVESSIVSQLNLKPNGQVRGGDPSGRNPIVFDTVRLDSLSLGGVVFRDVTAVWRQPRTGPVLPGVDGILGFGLFTDYLLTLDYPGKKLRLGHGELPAANGADILPFENPHVIPVVEISIGDFKMKAHIDSGNISGKFMLPAALVDKLKLASEPIIVGRARTISNEIEIKEVRLSDTIKLGSFEFNQPTIAFPAIADEANIGLKTLREFSLTFDQKNRRVKLERTLTTPAAATITPGSDGKDYGGRYGERTITAENDALYLQREGGPRLKLKPVSKDEFTLEEVPEARMKFVIDENGKIKELRVLNRSGEWEISKRQ